MESKLIGAVDEIRHQAQSTMEEIDGIMAELNMAVNEYDEFEEASRKLAWIVDTFNKRYQKLKEGGNEE